MKLLLLSSVFERPMSPGFVKHLTNPGDIGYLNRNPIQISTPYQPVPFDVEK